MSRSVANDAIPVSRLAAGPIPLYYKLEQELRRRIDAAEFEPGAMLPSEDRVCEEYGVSRITVRRALDALLQQGMITRRRGVGSFVANGWHGMDSRLTGSLNEFLASAAALRTTCLHMAVEVPPPSVATLFDIGPRGTATLVKTLGSLDQEGPVVYLEIWFPNDIGETLNPEELGGKTPIIRVVERRLGLRVVRADQVVEPDHAGTVAGHHLGIASDTPILRVKRVYYAHTNRPVEVAYARYHPHRYRYAIEFRS